MTGYWTVKIPRSLANEIDEVIAKHNLGFASRDGFIEDAVVRYLAKMKGLK